MNNCWSAVKKSLLCSPVFASTYGESVTHHSLGNKEIRSFNVFSPSKLGFIAGSAFSPNLQSIFLHKVQIIIVLVKFRLTETSKYQRILNKHIIEMFWFLDKHPRQTVLFLKIRKLISFEFWIMTINYGFHNRSGWANRQTGVERTTAPATCSSRNFYFLPSCETTVIGGRWCLTYYK